MACELIGAKLLAPYFGTSLYVWAAALAVTLGGLTVGYFLGGRLSRKYAGEVRLLYLVLLAAGLLLVVMPFTSEIIMKQAIGLSLEMGTVISLLIFMLPPLAFMGMVSPILINLLTDEVQGAGNSAGNVYAISTLGGILFTFLMGFYVIPNFGLTSPAIVVGTFLAIFPIGSLLKGKNTKASLGIIGLLLFSYLSIQSGEKYSEEYKVLYKSEGILGQVKVVDHPSYELTEDGRMGRALIVNNTLQTYVGLDHQQQYSIWGWSNYLPSAASVLPKGTNALLLGLGGGTIFKQFNRLGFNVEAVEIDKRIRDVSIQYFGLNPDARVIVDDARHYLKTTNKKYGAIVYDCFLGESVPEHLLTLEGFEDAKNKLTTDGMILINFYGFIKGDRGKAARSVYKTLEESGFYTEILATPGTEYTRNLIFVASLKERDFSEVNYSEPNYDRIEDLYDHFLDQRFINTKDAFVLSDRKPKLAKLYALASREWKKSYNTYYRKHFIK